MITNYGVLSPLPNYGAVKLDYEAQLWRTKSRLLSFIKRFIELHIFGEAWSYIDNIWNPMIDVGSPSFYHRFP